MWLGLFKQSTDTIRIIVRTKNNSGVLTAPTGDVVIRSWDDDGVDTTNNASQLDSRTGIYYLDITASDLDAAVRLITATFTVSGVAKCFHYRLQLY